MASNKDKPERVTGLLTDLLRRQDRKKALIKKWDNRVKMVVIPLLIIYIIYHYYDVLGRPQPPTPDWIYPGLED